MGEDSGSDAPWGIVSIKAQDTGVHRDTCWLVIACMDEMELHIQLSEMLGADKRLDRFDYLIGISM